MLILPKHLMYPAKHYYWQERTPNEEYAENPQYRQMVDEFIAKYKTPGGARFFEVRLVKPQENIGVVESDRWWDDALFIEKIFWVFDKPHLTKVRDDNPKGFLNFQAYYLEPFECQRVNNIGLEKFGYLPFPQDAAIMLPVECTQMAWDETSGGYSDHIRYRPNVDLTDREVDELETHKQEVSEIQKTLVDISQSGAFVTNDERRTEKLFTPS